MSLLTALISAAALNAAPALAGAAHGHGEAEAHWPARPSHDAAVHGARHAPHAGQGPAHRHHYAPLPAPSPRAVQLSPGFFYGPLTGGVERPPVRFYPVRQGYVIHHAPSGPLSAGQAAAARGLGQGGSE